MTLYRQRITEARVTSQKVALHPTAASHRFHMLDGLRGIAALLIFVYHLPFYLSHIRLQNTYIAVDFFFCLSGFVIAFSYQTRLTEGLSLKNFFAARVIRLYPIYLLGILFGLMDHRVSGTLSKGLVAIVSFQLAMLPSPQFLGNFFLFPLNIFAWSIFFELVANFAFASLVRFKLASNWLLASVALLCLLLLTLSVIQGLSIDAGWGLTWEQFYVGLTRVTFSFSMGVLIFRLFRKSQKHRPTHAMQWVLATAIPLLLTCFLMSSFPGRGNLVFLLLTIAVLFPALVFLGALSGVPSSWTHACVFLGDISYPVYLLQCLFLDMLHKPRVATFSIQHPLVAVVLIMLGLIAIAHLAVVFYDAPLRKRLSRYYNSMRSSRSTAP